VGPGWLLGIWSRNVATQPGQKVAGNVATPTNELFLVDPRGGRYVVSANIGAGTLASWSGDGRRALLTTEVGGTSGGSSTRLVQVDLASGRTGTSFSVPKSSTVFFGSATFTRPRGLALLVTTQTNDRELLQRYSPSGVLERTYPATFQAGGAFTGGVLSSPSGTQLVLGTSKGIALVGNDGTVLAQVLVPAVSECDPMRWWSTDVVLASCIGSNGSAQRLYEVPTTHGAATALTGEPRPPDAGDMNAWALGSGVYVQDAGGCGYVYLAKLQPGALTTPVAVPGVKQGNSVFVLGATKDQLAIQATLNCGPGESVLWFNAASDTTTIVLGPPVNGGSVSQALTYPDPNG
jgi:TolB protein